MNMELTSPAFSEGGFIPIVYTCKGKDISPALAWGDVPQETKSLALIMDDPDAPAGTWDHWILYNLPPNARGLPEDLVTLPEGAFFGRNSWKKNAYGGPCPPSGVHRYFFKLYALDMALPERPGLTKSEVLEAMQGHVLASAQLIGNYGTEAYATGDPKKDLAEVE